MLKKYLLIATYLSTAATVTAMESKTMPHDNHLFRAVLIGDLITVKQLLENKADIQAAQPNGCTPLHTAGQSGNEAMVRLLLENKANVDAATQRGATPLHWAAHGGLDAIVKLLLENKAKIEAVMKGGDTPLHLAAKQGHIAVFKALTEEGADVNAQNEEGFTPLQLAAQENHKIKVCSKCREKSNNKCSKCLCTFYCSENCQKKDWPEHKKVCKALKEILEGKSSRKSHLIVLKN